MKLNRWYNATRLHGGGPTSGDEGCDDDASSDGNTQSSFPVGNEHKPSIFSLIQRVYVIVTIFATLVRYP